MNAWQTKKAQHTATMRRRHADTQSKRAHFEIERNNFKNKSGGGRRKRSGANTNTFMADLLRNTSNIMNILNHRIQRSGDR